MARRVRALVAVAALAAVGASGAAIVDVSEPTPATSDRTVRAEPLVQPTPIVLVPPGQQLLATTPARG